MRSEVEMLGLIRQFADNDDRVRAVIMNGSRVNPGAPRDIFQDYDVVFIVTTVEAFVHDRSWMNRFGDLIIMQTPDETGFLSSPEHVKFAFLMLFADGNRIDLTFYPQDRLAEMQRDSLSVLLLDKDGTIEPFAAPHAGDYKTVPPTKEQFAQCCNEFWWVSTYVAKGLWRKELSYAKAMYEGPVRDMLILMLKWHIGIQTDFSADSGKLGKYFEQYLYPAHWRAFVQSFPDGKYPNIWQALFIMSDLFRETAITVSDHFGYEYNYDEDKRVTDYLRHVRELPADAERVY